MSLLFSSNLCHFSEYVDPKNGYHLVCRGWRETVSSQITSEKTDTVTSHLALHEKLFLFGQSGVEMLGGKVVF